MNGSCSISRVSCTIGGRHRGREEERLALGRQVLQDAADVGQEAHVEHAVGLVEDEDLEPLELRVGEPEVVEQTARRRDEDVHAACGTRAPAGPCRRRRRRRPTESGVWTASCARCSSICAASSRVGVRTSARVMPRWPPMRRCQDRQEERGGLAAAGHRAGEHVAAREGGRDRVLLDRRRAREPQFLHAAKEVGVDSELGERHASRVLSAGPPDGRRTAVISSGLLLFGNGTEESPARPAFVRRQSLSHPAAKSQRGG